MKRDYSLFLKDMLAAINSIETFVEEMTLAGFMQDDKTASAVIRKFEIIGEAVKQLPEDFRKKHSEIPWNSMAGMRDRLIHAYFGIDFRLVWDAIQMEIPKLKADLKKILVELEKEKHKK